MTVARFKQNFINSPAQPHYQSKQHDGRRIPYFVPRIGVFAVWCCCLVVLVLCATITMKRCFHLSRQRPVFHSKIGLSLTFGLGKSEFPCMIARV